jgi:DNA-3-methyladenine glycosylase
VGPRLDRSWFERDAPAVARDLLGKLLHVELAGIRCTGRIVETEAYMPDDPASHTFNGQTNRNAVMFGPPGHLYVYLSYGIHHCANVVTGPVGSGQAVLIRAIEPVGGLDVMEARRGRSGRELSNGPGKLCRALGITADHDGLDLVASQTIWISDDGAKPDKTLVGQRVGISKGVQTPWRFRSVSR